MRPSLTSLRRRFADSAELVSKRAHEVAGGTSTPAGQGQTVAEDEVRPGARQRASMRRRARRTRRIREGLLRDLGLLVLELERRGRPNPELVRRKAQELRAIDDELRGLAAALGRHDTVERVALAGIAGSCRACGSLLGNDDKFCASCGTPKLAAPAGESSPELVGTSPAKPQ